MREEGGEVRQPPWVTFALILLLLSSFVYLRAERSEVDAQLRSSLGEAEEYFHAHPYLTLPELLGDADRRRSGGADAGALSRGAAQPRRAAGARRHPAPRAAAAGRPGGRSRGPRFASIRHSAGACRRAGIGRDAPQPRAPARGLAAPAREPLRAAPARLLPGRKLGSLALRRPLRSARRSPPRALSARWRLRAPGSGSAARACSPDSSAPSRRASGEGWRDPARALVFATGSMFLAAPLMMGVQWSVVREGSGVAASTSSLVLALAFGFGAAAAAAIRVSQLDRILGRRAPIDAARRGQPGPARAGARAPRGRPARPGLHAADEPPARGSQRSRRGARALGRRQRPRPPRRGRRRRCSA